MFTCMHTCIYIYTNKSFHTRKHPLSLSLSLTHTHMYIYIHVSTHTQVRSIFHYLVGKVPQKPSTLHLNFRSHTGILEAADVILEWLFRFFPGSVKLLPKDDGLCKGPRPAMGVWGMAKLAKLLGSPESGVVVLTPDHNIGALNRALAEHLGNATVTVLGIREAKGLDFAEVLLVDFFKCLDVQQHKSWKKMLQSSPSVGFQDAHPEVAMLICVYTYTHRYVQIFDYTCKYIHVHEHVHILYIIYMICKYIYFVLSLSRAHSLNHLLILAHTPHLGTDTQRHTLTHIHKHTYKQIHICALYLYVYMCICTHIYIFITCTYNMHRLE